MKQCTKCKNYKDFTEFARQSNRVDGFQSHCKECNKEYRAKNKERQAESNKRWRLANREKYNQSKRVYFSKKVKNDSNLWMRTALRIRLNKALKNNQRAGSAVKDLGCSIQELKTYLESKFQPGMTWENHGEWHIDHVKPLTHFDLTDRVQFVEACNFKNLQPLWAIDNLKKGAKYGKTS